MTVRDVCAFLDGARVVDLSKKVEPGKAEAPFGMGKRRYELEPFTFPPGELMHYVSMESHISTHVEAPCHYVNPRYHQKGKDVSELDLRLFMGMGLFVDCRDLPPRTGILPGMLEGLGVRAGDIVLMGNARHGAQDRVFIEEDTIDLLCARRIKMAGVDDSVLVEHPRYLLKNFERYYVHDKLLSAGIPIIEGLANLGALKTTRFLFLGIPAKMGGLESFPIRAVAVEEVS